MSGAAIFTVPLPVSVCDSWVGTVIVTVPVAVVVPFMTSVPVPANVLVPVNVKLWALRTALDASDTRPLFATVVASWSSVVPPCRSKVPVLVQARKPANANWPLPVLRRVHGGVRDDSAPTAVRSDGGAGPPSRARRRRW